MDLASAKLRYVGTKSPTFPRPLTLLALVRAATLATFAATEVALPSRVLGAAALYVVGACVLGNLRPKWRGLDVFMLITIVCADIAWCTAAFVYFGPQHSLPAVLYAAFVAAIVAVSSGWTAIIVGLSTSAVYGMTMLLTHREAPLPLPSVHLAIFQAIVIALSGTLSGCLADQWRRLCRAQETIERLRRLNEASAQTVASEGSDQAVLQYAAQAALRVLDAQRAWVMRSVKGQEESLVLVAHAGFEMPDRQDCITRGAVGIAGKVSNTGRGVLLSTTRRKAAQLSALEAQLSLGQLIAAPIPSDEGLDGVLLATREEDAPSFAEEDLAVLSLLGRAVSTLLQTAGLIRELHLSSTTDSLTGLYNHGVFLQKLADHVQAARETGKELSLIVLDMDGFKQINDTAGHWEGNRVLRALADALRASCRETDVIARCGGDEFAVLLPGIGPDGAAAVAERTALALQAASVRPGIRIPISASWGIASYPWDASTDEELFRRADDRLYQAKQAGGNHVAFDPAAIGAPGEGTCVKPAGQLLLAKGMTP